MGPLRLALQVRVELDGLPDSPMCRHHVLLADIGSDASEKSISGPSVHEHLPTVLGGFLRGEHVQERRLAAAARAHDRHQLPRCEVARARLKDDLLLATSAGWKREGQVFEGQAGRRQRIGRPPNLSVRPGRILHQRVRADAGRSVVRRGLELRRPCRALGEPNGQVGCTGARRKVGDGTRCFRVLAAGLLAGAEQGRQCARSRHSW
mmetsp:Transcript_5363/g.20249  ORF Transcript_5363/g.20249 Transcript_5363/m.20249 type:complete len:207 (-) Transcript_5363:44-664(-)